MTIANYRHWCISGVWIVWVVGTYVMGLSTCRAVNNLKPRFGIVTVHLENETQMFFKREVRGLSYDLLVLSMNPNPCHSADPARDYIFSAQGPHVVYYKVDGDKLRVYSASQVTKPEGGRITNIAEVHLLEVSAFLEIRDAYRQNGLISLDVHLNVPTEQCR